jgi:hypothetical protein
MPLTATQQKVVRATATHDGFSPTEIDEFRRAIRFRKVYINKKYLKILVKRKTVLQPTISAMFAPCPATTSSTVQWLVMKKHIQSFRKVY